MYRMPIDTIVFTLILIARQWILHFPIYICEAALTKPRESNNINDTAITNDHERRTAKISPCIARAVHIQLWTDRVGGIVAGSDILAGGATRYIRLLSIDCSFAHAPWLPSHFCYGVRIDRSAASEQTDPNETTAVDKRNFYSGDISGYSM